MVGRLYGSDRAVGQGARARAARALRAGRRRGKADEDLLGRDAPPPGPRCCARRQAARAVPRRAHDRPRPPQPAQPVGGHREPRRRGHDRAADDPVPRRGRPPGRPDSGHRSRPRDRRGHVRPAQGSSGRRASGGPPGPDRRRGGRRARARSDVRRAPHRRARPRQGERARAQRRHRGGRAPPQRRGRRRRRPCLAPAHARRRVPRADGHAADETRDDLRRRSRPREAIRHRHADHRRTQPDPPAARARTADRVHAAADHVRAALPLRVRRRDPHARLQLRRLPAAGDHRAEHRLRRLRHGARAQRGHAEGTDRSLPLAAHVARRRARRTHALRRCHEHAVDHDPAGHRA